MKKKFYRVISVIISLSLMMSLLSTVSLADWSSDGYITSDEYISTDSEDNMPYLETVLVKLSDDAPDSPDYSTDYYEEVSADGIEAGDTIIVAIKAYNFEKFTLNNYGVYQLSTSIVYDTDYLTPSQSSNSKYRSRALALLEYAGSDCFYNAPYNYEDYPGEYELDTASSVRSTDLADGESSTLTGGNLSKAVLVQSAVPDDSTDEEEQLGVVEEGSYVAFYEFTVSAVPDDGAYTAAVSLSRSESIVLQLQNTGVFNKTYTANDGLHQYLKLVDTVNLFPAMYSIDFYNDSTLESAADVDALSLAEGTLITDDDIPTSDKFTGATGKYFETLKYTTTGTADPDTDSEFVAGVEVTADMKVYATWEDGYTVTLHSNYGTDSTATITVAPTGEATISQTDIDDALATVTWDSRDDYSIIGWTTTSGGASADFTLDSDTITGDTDLYAVWAQQVDVVFNSNDSTAPSTDKVTVQAGKSVDAGDVPPYKRENYTLSSWNTAANGSGDTIDPTEIPFTTGTTLYAQWTPTDGQTTATLTYDPVLTDVTVSPSTITVVSGDTILASQAPADPTAEDYTFLGWYTSAAVNCTDQFSLPTTITENTTVYAHWSYTGAGAVTVTFYDNYNVDAYATITVAPNTTLGDAMPTSPSRDGYAFASWNTATDGTGDAFEKTTSVTTSIDVYAQYTKDITVSYDVNGGSGEISDVSGQPDETYSDPTAPTRTNYSFLGWNTAQNGSGKYITAASYSTLQAVYEAAGSTSSTITLYAQWGAVKDATEFDPDDDDTPIDPSSTGVVVTFDENVGADDGNQVTTHVNPKYKYPNLNDSIGTGNMPNEPERSNYTFLGWYTQPGGQGTQVTGDTEIKTSLDGVTEATDGGYELTVYACWGISDELAEGQEKVTLTFYDNIDGKGTSSTVIKTVEVLAGDSLGYLPTITTTNGYYDAMGWSKTASNEDDTDLIGADTVITADTDVFIRWKLYVSIDIYGDTSTTYIGKEIEPTFTVQKVDEDSNASGTYLYDTDTKPLTAAELVTYFDFSYELGGYSADSILNAGTYVIDVNATSDYETAGLEVNGGNYYSYIVNKADLDVSIADKTTQKQSYGSATEPEFEITGYVGDDVQDGKPTESAAATIKYLLWTDSDGDGEITSTELATESTTINSTTAIGYYVVTVTPTSNYKIGDTSGVTVYPTASDDSGLPVYAAGTEGNNIYFQVAASDPSISSIKVYPVEDGTANTDSEADLKTSDYTTGAEFDSSDDPETTTYYIRLDAGTDGIEFDFELTNPDTTTVTYSYGDTTDATVTPNGSTYTVKIDELTNTGSTANTITITTESSGGDTITYTFYVQVLVEAKIELNYGNSPYGEIMKATNIADEDKDAAKAAFNEGDKFTATYCPDDFSTSVYYSTKAWGESTDSSVNMDRNDYAIFAFEYSGFTDPGFSITDSLGESVDLAKVTRSISVYVMSGTDMDITVSDDIKNTYSVSGEATNDTFTHANLANSSISCILPGVYELTYTYTDSVNGETSFTRNVVILPLMGDTNLDGKISVGDLTPIKNDTVQNPPLSSTTANKTTYNLFYYRVMDTNYDTKVSVGDLTPIKNETVGNKPSAYYY